MRWATESNGCVAIEQRISGSEWRKWRTKRKNNLKHEFASLTSWSAFNWPARSRSLSTQKCPLFSGDDEKAFYIWIAFSFVSIRFWSLKLCVCSLLCKFFDRFLWGILKKCFENVMFLFRLLISLYSIFSFSFSLIKCGRHLFDMGICSIIWLHNRKL